MSRKIKCHDSWNMGREVGMKHVLEKNIKIKFDKMYAQMIEQINEIEDRELIEKLVELLVNDESSKHDFDLMLNTIVNTHREYKAEKKE